MSDNNNNNNPTLKSYIDQATGMAQNAINSVTGSGSGSSSGSGSGSGSGAGAGSGAATQPDTQAPDTQKEAPSTGGASYAGANPSWNQTLGSAKESLGNLTGNENLRRAGMEQNAQGKADEAKGQLQDWGTGMGDRAQGAVGSVGAAIKGDRVEEEKWRKIHDEGKEKQLGAEADMERRT